MGPERYESDEMGDLMPRCLLRLRFVSPLSRKGPRESEGMGAVGLISVNSDGMDNS